MLARPVLPPNVAPWSVTDDDRRRQTPAIVTGLAPYTMCRRASNILTYMNYLLKVGLSQE